MDSRRTSSLSEKAKQLETACEGFSNVNSHSPLEGDLFTSRRSIGFHLMISGSIKYSNSTGSDRSYDNDYGSVIGSRAVIVRDFGAGGTPYRTLGDVRQQVAQEVAVRVITNAETIDGEKPARCSLIKCLLWEGVRVGVSLTYSKSDDSNYLHRVADVVELQLSMSDYLFVIATTGKTDIGANPLIICGSCQDFVQRAILLTSSKFLGRVESVTSEENRWFALVKDIAVSMYDEDALWDVVRKSARAPIDPLAPPPGSRGIDRILSDARAKLQRISPMEAYNELRESPVGAPTFLVDIRPAAQRDAEGGIHGSLIIERNVLEWRFDPRSDARLPIVDRYDLRVIVFCQEGYTSRLLYSLAISRRQRLIPHFISLAAFSLHQLGLLNATDIIGGYQAWKEAGLPVDILQPLGHEE
jgi:rhodanese-related sulfurtransferase